MAKPLPPEVLALVPNGIENLVLRCVVCGDSLPPSRRTIGDHAGPCHKVRVLYRRYIIQLTKCIACLHPSTPKEREEYKQWRKSRGDLREKCGKPKKINTEIPEKALDKSVDVFATPPTVVSRFDEVDLPQDIV
jgi:hypothetical protein